VSGRLAPGQQVRDAQLAADLGLSIAPVRQALARLSEEGLIESKARSHTRVTPVTMRAVRDALAVVRAMHELATRAAVPQLQPQDETAMRAANARFRQAIADDDTTAALAADDALHGVLVDRCANQAVRATIDRFVPTIRRLELQRFSAATALTSADAHDELIDAAVAGRVDDAVALTARIWSAL
jgi:DNA-binding GntR family transcriptional regulator